MDWKECIDKKIAKNIKEDQDLIRSLQKESENKMQSSNSIVMKETSASSKLVLAYDSLREVLEAIAIKNSYKIYNHECYTCFLKEVMNESEKADEFDAIRKLRNAINYYGKEISIEEATKTIKQIVNLREKLLPLLQGK